MCDSATRTIVEGIVRRRVSLGNDWTQCPSVPMHKDAMFTALDISREAQQVHNVRERHRDMKHVVHEMFDSGELTGYQRKLVTVLPGVPQAWVYHPQFADPDTYGAGGQTLSVTHAPTPTASSPATVSATNLYSLNPAAIQNTGPTNPDQHQVDKRGRLTIPVSLVSSLGLKPTDWAFASPSPTDNKVVISVQLDPSKWVDAYRYRVDKSGNLRISQSCLVEASCTDPVLEIKQVNDTIVVAP